MTVRRPVKSAGWIGCSEAAVEEEKEEDEEEDCEEEAT